MATFDLSTYIDTQQRINRLWQEHPNARILTEMVSDPADFERVVFKASVYKDASSSMPDVTGWAAEAAGTGGMANRTSWHENCETSAIGRALANMGYAKTVEDRPSREEIGKVNRATQTTPQQRNAGTQQGERPANVPQARNGVSGPSEAQIRFLHALAKENGLDHDGLHAQINARFGKSSVKELTGGNGGEASRLIEWLKAKDLIDGVPVAAPREDPVEAAQQGSGFMGAGVEEPAYLRDAPDRWA